MAAVDRQLRDNIPSFDKHDGDQPVDISNWSGLASELGLIKSGAEWLTIVAVFAAIIGSGEFLLRWFEVPPYIMPTPSLIFMALIRDFHLIAPHIGYTLIELFSGFAIGASVGFVLAALV